MTKEQTIMITIKLPPDIEKKIVSLIDEAEANNPGCEVGLRSSTGRPYILLPMDEKLDPISDTLKRIPEE